MTQRESVDELLEPGIDIDAELQRRILEFERSLGSCTHYELLGVAKGADKKEIKSAYYALMNEFHTDKYYGRNLGSFGARMSKIVDALTKANDTLGRRKTREEYDQYLQSRISTLGARASEVPRPTTERPEDSDGRAPSGRRAVAPIDVVRIPVAPPAPSLTGPASQSPGSATSDEASVSFEVDSHPQSAPGSRERPSSEQPARARGDVLPPQDARRKRLARKMGRKSQPGNDQQRRNAVRADLRARFDARKDQEIDRITRYREAAEEGIRTENWAGAVNSIRMALSLKPHDAELVAEVEAIQEQADRALAPKFLEQAKYEEKDGRLERAARSYERAARGLRAAELFNKGAGCLLQLPRLSEDEQRKAVEMARGAVHLEKRNAPYRITLARAYDAAGMKTSALGEIGRALELEPDNDEAKDLQKRLK